MHIYLLFWDNKIAYFIFTMYQEFRLNKTNAKYKVIKGIKRTK